MSDDYDSVIASGSVDVVDRIEFRSGATRNAVERDGAEAEVEHRRQ